MDLADIKRHKEDCEARLYECLAWFEHEVGVPVEEVILCHAKTGLDNTKLYGVKVKVGL